ncbi:hypothetical protein ABZ916_24075 [Streptomyces sp. NPDC046853]|uniref:hypothetical protein n=1 Tax=Streptomyces sp. NPDC046853 TaxID=3154920 RepID=UPI0033EB982E
MCERPGKGCPSGPAAFADRPAELVELAGLAGLADRYGARFTPTHAPATGTTSRRG